MWVFAALLLCPAWNCFLCFDFIWWQTFSSLFVAGKEVFLSKKSIIASFCYSYFPKFSGFIIIWEPQFFVCLFWFGSVVLSHLVCRLLKIWSELCNFNTFAILYIRKLFYLHSLWNEIGQIAWIFFPSNLFKHILCVGWGINVYTDRVSLSFKTYNLVEGYVYVNKWV